MTRSLSWRVFGSKCKQKQKIIIPLDISMNRIVGHGFQGLKMIQVNSGLVGFHFNAAERTVVCYGSKAALKHAQKLMDIVFYYFETDWKTILFKYLDYPELYPDDILFEDESLVVVKDGYPKAKYHFLVLVKDRNIKGILIFI